MAKSPQWTQIFTPKLVADGGEFLCTTQPTAQHLQGISVTIETDYKERLEVFANVRTNYSEATERAFYACNLDLPNLSEVSPGTLTFQLSQEAWRIIEESLGSYSRCFTIMNVCCLDGSTVRVFSTRAYW
eukprot:scaffold936_cov106-Amphora_coffeaeformis.AAC.4